MPLAVHLYRDAPVRVYACGGRVVRVVRFWSGRAMHPSGTDPLNIHRCTLLGVHNPSLSSLSEQQGRAVDQGNNTWPSCHFPGAAPSHPVIPLVLICTLYIRR